MSQDVHEPAGRVLRAVRAAAAAATCVLVAAGAHVSAGGAASPLAFGLLLLGSGAVAHALAGRRVTTGQLLGLLVLAQAVVHLACATPETSRPGAMLAGHAVATVLSTLALSRGEAACWRLAELLGLDVVVRLRRGTVVPAARRVAARGRVAAPRRRERVAVVDVRGPPVACA